MGDIAIMSDIDNKIDRVIIADAMYRGIGRGDEPVPGGIAICGDTIVAIGTEEDLKPLIGSNTDVRRFGADKLLIPAICDAHLHLENTVLCESGPTLRFVTSEAECVANAKAWHEENPGSYWVIGFGWHQANWPGAQVPDKKLLSEALPDNPAFLMDIDTHCAWVNQKFFDEMGITAETPDPEGGRIWRYENGEPSGYLEESAAIGIEPDVLKRAISDPLARRGKLARTIEILNRRGVTEVFDAFDTPQTWYEAVEDLKSEGLLNIRLNTSVLINGVDDYIEKGLDLAKRYPNREDYITFWGFKVVGDGVGGAHTAWMTEPYADDPTCFGACLMDPDEMKRRVLECLGTGHPIHIHACGTATVHHALDCIEEATAHGLTRGERNVITHCDTVNAEDFARFRSLGIVAALQPDMMAPTPTYETDFYRPFFGEEVYKLSWANRAMFDNCDYISFSSDSPVGFAGTLHQIFRSTERVFNDGKPEGGINPEQKISVAEALWAYTWGGAYQLGKEQLKGSIEVGKRADIAVLDHNLFTCNADEIVGTESVLTLIDGRIAYEKHD